MISSEQTPNNSPDTPSFLKGKKIILGVSGSIAAYKSPLLVRELVKLGADVHVVITPNAQNFVSPLVLNNLSRNPVSSSMFDESVQNDGSWHIHLARRADAMLVAPCSLKTLASLAHGLADTALTCLAFALPPTTPLIIAPAMDTDMWGYPATQRAVNTLRNDGAVLIEPDTGELASGLIGKGRMPEPATIVTLLNQFFRDNPTFDRNTYSSSAPQYLRGSFDNPETDFTKTEKPIISDEVVQQTARQSSRPIATTDIRSEIDFTVAMELDKLKQQTNPSVNEQILKGKKVLITAGPTFEKIDAVRFIGNYSTGKMGFALAETAYSLGAKVVLISGPVSLASPNGVETIRVESAKEMYTAVFEHLDYDIAILSAAVADFMPVVTHKYKLKKEDVGQEATIELTRTPDILRSLGEQKTNKQYLVGFALETSNELEYGEDKLRKKNCDMIVVNSANKPDSGFGGDYNTITLLSKSNDGNIKTEVLPPMSKKDCAGIICSRVSEKISQ
jgi:phosphopantothenoylcysteine decarboxylase / phosphopantothenate---cysteine ligase